MGPSASETSLSTSVSLEEVWSAIFELLKKLIGRMDGLSDEIERLQFDLLLWKLAFLAIVITYLISTFRTRNNNQNADGVNNFNALDIINLVSRIVILYSDFKGSIRAEMSALKDENLLLRCRVERLERLLDAAEPRLSGD